MLISKQTSTRSGIILQLYIDFSLKSNFKENHRLTESRNRRRCLVGCDLTLSLIEQPKPALLLFYSNARQVYLLKKRASGSLFLHPFPSGPAKTVTFFILLCLTPPGGKGLRLFSHSLQNSTCSKFARTRKLVGQF